MPSPTDYRKTRYTHRRGTRADQPAAVDVLIGTLYYVTDEGVLERATESTWESYSSSYTPPSFTDGSVIFYESGNFAQDNTNFFWDNTNNYLRVPKIVGGSGVNDDLILQATDGVGTNNSRVFIKVGNNGSLTAVEILPDGSNAFARVGIGTAGLFSVDAPLFVYGEGADIGYVAKFRASNSNPSCFIQAITGSNANAQPGFSFTQIQNEVEWRMAVVGNEGNAMRWTYTNFGGSPVTRNVVYVTIDGVMVLDTTASSYPGAGSKALVFGDGTPLSSMASNTCGLYGDDVSGTVNLFAINEAGDVNQLSGDIKIASGKYFYTQAASFMIRGLTSFTNGAAANTGTLTNAPAAGDPTKWIPIDDNGTTRYIPAW